ncbi:mucoidy inhibitor MuiA family protein [Tenuifilum sp.]|uniref:mucoidy inhibitor MuiA family protein n=1 Tax=Tenuifilum sp. TaxID=2760880 RepID=UPI002CDB9EBA|nr:mucoidy inhibitor MuiA family protein [Tenuifilum sp.]HQG73505.1 mucoidy inhibitor MuiA family protein [Tenuifilum sp.]HRS45162.1 mucoidy inhibitor MuiA family protein [Tenuifilum sp.]HRU87221.1 mucoidy inhibitor MuiA family protein [Tenuifilum sp.]
MKRLAGILMVALQVLPYTILAQKAVEVNSNITDVVVYLDAASITRKAQVNLPEGRTKISFTGLSPFIDFKTISITTPEGVSIESINHSNNYLSKKDKNEEAEMLTKKLSDLEAQQKVISTSIAVVNEEINFLNDNRSISGKNEAVSVQTLKDASTFYGSRIKELRFKSLELSEQHNDITKKIEETRRQLSVISSKPSTPTGEIEVLLETNSPKNEVPIVVNYLVKNAGWFPRYDIKANVLDRPITLVYKANIRQETKEDWKNVKVKLTNSEPNVSGVAPALKPYLLNYGLQPPRYGKIVNVVQGRVTDTHGNPLPGTNIVISGTSIGTIANTEGKYSINIPTDANSLTFSMVGFKPRTLPINSNTINVVMEEDEVRLEEVTVVAYGVASDDYDRSRKSEVRKEAPKPKITGGAVTESGILEKLTSVEFELAKPFSLESENKSQDVKLLTYEIPAEFKYSTTPKVDKGAYLWVNIPAWEMYNLLDGEANVFFENTYTGSTLIDTRKALDTLQLSLGVDKSISVKREKVKEFTKKQLIGSSKEETRSWKITIKNNKSQDISITVLDQIPVSINEEIKVNVLEKSNAAINPENGEVKWDLLIPAGQFRELILTYSVRYPKNRNLYVE